MTEITALDKHACPACGAQAEWNPGKQKLICPYCGTESPYRVENQLGVTQCTPIVRSSPGAGAGRSFRSISVPLQPPLSGGQSPNATSVTPGTLPSRASSCW